MNGPKLMNVLGMVLKKFKGSNVSPWNHFKSFNPETQSSSSSVAKAGILALRLSVGLTVAQAIFLLSKISSPGPFQARACDWGTCWPKHMPTCIAFRMLYDSTAVGSYLFFQRWLPGLNPHAIERGQRTPLLAPPIARLALLAQTYLDQRCWKV